VTSGEATNEVALAVGSAHGSILVAGAQMKGTVKIPLLARYDAELDKRTTVALPDAPSGSIAALEVLDFAGLVLLAGWVSEGEGTASRAFSRA
jgi:hypothetical protein